MNKVKSQSKERGQALVIMVFGMIVLLIAVGLAVDGGAILLERRRMQNSADASALAGTRVLASAICSKDGADDAAVLATVQQYATENGVRDPASGIEAYYVGHDEVALGLVGSGSIPKGATGVSATVNITSSTNFMMLAGIDEASASAAALAMTGPPLLMGGGMRPFGVPHDVVGDLDPEDENNNSFEITFKKDGGTIMWGDGNISQHRGWMNMAYLWNVTEDPDFPRALDENASANDLKGWMANGWDGTVYFDCLWNDGCANGDYVHAKPGTNSSAVCKAPEDPVVIQIPVYDYILECETEIPSPKPDCPTQGGGYCYHIVGVASVKITNCNQGKGEIELILVDLQSGEGMPSLSEATGYGGEHACLTHTQVVKLWK